MAEKNSGSKGKDACKGSGMNVAGPSSGISTRLPSFRGPRDLTLSASTSGALVKPSLATRQRKTFSPNIPVRREKLNKVLDTQSDKAPKRNRDRDKGQKNGRGRGRGRAKEVIQTTGSLFGEGVAAAPRRRGMMGGYGGHGTGDGSGGGAGKLGEPGFIHKPVLNLDSVNNIDKDHEDQKLKEILRDDFLDDPEDNFGECSDDDDLLPIQLPMLNTGRGFEEEDSKDHKLSHPHKWDSVAIKSEPEDPNEDVKEDLDDKLDIKPPNRNVPSKGGFPAKKKPPELSVGQLLTCKHKELMFLQLPNSLPSHPPEVKHEPNITRSQNSTQQQQQQEKSSTNVGPDEEEVKKSKNQYCTLNTLPEGQIGKLKVYKSGKVELWFGNHRLTVNKGTQVGFLQDAASVEVDEENKTGDMTVLGHVRHRLVCTPDLEGLVKQMKSS